MSSSREKTFCCADYEQFWRLIRWMEVLKVVWSNPEHKVLVVRQRP